MTKLNDAAKLLGRRGGQAKSERKAESSRQNGKLGGRPMNDPIYTRYRSQPPDPSKRTSVTVIAAYFDGFEGLPRKYVRSSKCWWAYEAGRANAKAAH